MKAARALVLGGGGPVGIAWEAGVAAGLADAGVDLMAADFVLGTSAGSFVGAQLAVGRTAQSLAHAQIELGKREAQARASGETSRNGVDAAPNLAPLIQMMAKAPVESEPPADLLREVGGYAMAAQTMNEEDYIAGFGWLAREGVVFPARYACTAVDAQSGAFRMWRAHDGAPLGRAVASSCSVPGIFPPVAIQGRLYVDGGIRTPTNADLAAGHERVLIFAVMTAALADFMRRRMRWEIAAIESAGGRAEMIAPDEEAVAAFGPNLMDGSRRGLIAEAGRRQGAREAARISAFWKGSA